MNGLLPLRLSCPIPVLPPSLPLPRVTGVIVPKLKLQYMTVLKGQGYGKIALVTYTAKEIGVLLLHNLLLETSKQCL